MKFSLTFCFTALLACLIGGCAFTDSTVKIDYKPSTFCVTETGVKQTISVERFTDQRGVEPNLLSYKGVRHRTSGKYLSDREVSAVVTDATRALLACMGYSIVDGGGNYRFSGEILKFDSTPIMGFWSGELEGTIQVNLRVKDGEKSTIIWNEMLSGTAKKTGLQVDGETHRQEVAESTLDSLMRKIAESESLKKALETRNASTLGLPAPAAKLPSERAAAPDRQETAPASR